MGDALQALNGKIGLDVTDFKTGIAAANRELRVLESGFRAGVAALGDWSQSATGLEARIQSLISQIDIQRLKIAALREEYERVKAEKGENSRAAQDLEIKLNKETETLGKMQVELGETETALAEVKEGSDDAGDSVEESGSQAEEAGNKWETFKSVLAGAGAIAKGVVTTLAAVAASAIAVGAAVAGLTFSSAATADELATLSVQTGISTTTLQEMKYAGDQLGFSLDTLTGANARLIRSMDNAAQKADGELAKAFDTLGVSVVDANGNLRDSQDVMGDVIDALGRIENPAERDALAMQIFGKSAQELNPLIAAGSDELARLADEAHRIGAVVSSETIETLANLSDQLDGLKDGLKGVGLNIAAAFAPFFSGALTQAQGYLIELNRIVTESGGDFGKMAEGLAGLLTTIATDIASQAPAMLQAGLSIVQAFLRAITGALPQLLKAGVEIIRSLAQFIVQNLPMLIGAAVPILLMLVQTIVENLPMLIEAALQAILALAQGLTDALPELIPAIVQALLLIIQTLVDNLPMIVDAAAQLILALAQGLTAATPLLVPALAKLIPSLVDALLVSLPLLVEAGGLLIVELARGLVAAIPAETRASASKVIEEFLVNLAFEAIRLVKSGQEILRNLKNGIINSINMLADFGSRVSDALDKAIRGILPALLGIGKAIVQGVWAGIQAAEDWFYGLIYNFFDGIVESVLDALGISSPSKVFAEIGKYTIQGFAVGFEEEFVRVQRRIAQAMGGLGPNLQPAFASAGGLGGYPSSQNNIGPFFAPVIIQGQQSPNSLGAAIKAKRF